MNASQFRGHIEKVGKINAAKRLNPKCSTEEHANSLIYDYILNLLLFAERQAMAGQIRKCLDLKTAAAIMLWGRRLFDPRPSCVQEVWKGIELSSKSLIQGAGSMGKSYSAMVWFLMDYYADPDFTTIKLISTTAGHAKSNTYATLARLHEGTVVPMPGNCQSDYIGPDSKKRDAGIEIVAIPQGEDNKGALQGFHPKPRAEVHPVFGEGGRVRAFMDECEEIPSGVWQGIANMLLSMSGQSRVKVCGAYNPKDISSLTARNAEPEDGWDSFDLDTGVNGSNRWISREGWLVTRLDGKYFENVLARKDIYFGFITYDGFRNLEAKNEGQSPEFYTFGRGAYPPLTAICIIIGHQYITAARGEFTFEGRATPCAGVDSAVDGRDDAVMTRARYGRAISFRRVRKVKGREISEIIKFPQPRWALQVDAQINLPKGETKIVGDAIKLNCEAWGVEPDWCSIDATGNGSAIWSYLRAIWSEDVQGTDWGGEASELRIMDEDKKTPAELYEYACDELWFAAARWFEFGHIAIAPSVPDDPLEAELRSRRYKQGQGRKLRVEKKDDYKKRMGSRSPDRADSMLQTLHGVRMKRGAIGQMVENKKKKPKPEQPKAMHGAGAKASWISDGPSLTRKPKHGPGPAPW